MTTVLIEASTGAQILPVASDQWQECSTYAAIQAVYSADLRAKSAAHRELAAGLLIAREPEPESCQHVYPGYGSEPPEHCDEDPEEDSDYCAAHGPNGGPDPDAAYDNRFM